MRGLFKVAAISLVVLAALWTAGTLYVMHGVKTPEYEVISLAEDYELRRSPALLVAETRSEQSTDGNGLFRVLAGFIFGDNESEDEIAMTAPVLMSH